MQIYFLQINLDSSYDPHPQLTIIETKALTLNLNSVLAALQTDSLIKQLKSPGGIA